MTKSKKDQTGFSAVEIIVVLLVVAMVGVAGFIVYKNHNAASQSTAVSTPAPATSRPKVVPAADPYAGWQSYSDKQVSFKYPGGWQAGPGANKFAAAEVGATSPAFVSNVFTTATNPGAAVTLFLHFDSNSSTVYCSNDPCTVVAAVPLHNPQIPNAVLAVVDQTSANGTKYSQYVVASNNTKVGATTVEAVKAGANGSYTFGQPYYSSKDGMTTAAHINDVTGLQADTHFKNLVQLINSLRFN